MLHENRLKSCMIKLEQLLSLVQKVYLFFDFSRESSTARSCNHDLSNEIGHFIAEFPKHFDKEAISIFSYFGKKLDLDSFC